MRPAAHIPASGVQIERLGAWLCVFALGAGCHTAPAGAPANGAPNTAVAVAEPPRASGAVDAAPSPANQCASDADCVPASCCHASACVPRGKGPVCQAAICTMMCEPHSIDCGGKCFCQSGRCGALLYEQLPREAPR